MATNGQFLKNATGEEERKVETGEREMGGNGVGGVFILIPKQ